MFIFVLTFGVGKIYNVGMFSKEVMIIIAGVAAFASIFSVAIGVPTGMANNEFVAQIEQQAPLLPSVDFIQSWYACSLGAEDWNIYFETLAQLGFDTVILQSSFDNESGEVAYYESQTYPSGEYYSSTLELMLTSADKHNFDVYVGTYTPQNWWNTNYNDQYVADAIAVHNILFEEIYTKYHTHKSFVGWYYTPEMFSTILGYENQWIKLLNGVIDGIEKYGNGLPMIFSPYRGKYTSPFLEWGNTFDKVCKGVHFRKGDVLAPQDGFGAHSPNKQSYTVELYEFAQYCLNATEGTNLTLWINCELFSSRGQFCSKERMLQQFRLANAFCNKTLCFSFAHYAFAAEDKTLFEDYKEIYQAR